MIISKGLIILISGIVLFIGTFIWIYIDSNNKEIKEQELLKKIEESSAHVKTSSIISMNDTIDMLDYSTDMLSDSTELLDSTENI